MNKKDIELDIMFTPWTIDTYSTFTSDREEECIIEYESEKAGRTLTCDDIDWTYDNTALVKMLADHWQYLMNENIIDDVILGVALKGEPWSPREYNFSTDDCNVVFTVDHKQLVDYVNKHIDAYNKEKLHSYDGFMWFGDDDTTMLAWYLAHKSASDYTEDSYIDDQMDMLYGNGGMSECIEYKVKATA